MDNPFQTLDQSSVEKQSDLKVPSSPTTKSRGRPKKDKSVTLIKKHDEKTLKSYGLRSKNPNMFLLFLQIL